MDTAANRNLSIAPATGLTTVDQSAVNTTHDGPLLPDRGQPEAGRYVLGEEIARGGMGVIYKANDRAFGREVAVKVMQGLFVHDDMAGRRFADEGRITGRFQHPGIPPVHDTGTLPDGGPFLAMKLVTGETLDALLSRRPNPAADRGRFVAVFEQVCQATAYAHAEGVLHRDLKPANVMVGAFGEVQVMGWGLAKVLADGPDADSVETTGAGDTDPHDSECPCTEAGVVLGTPAFMPPEQASGGAARSDARNDVFGLGAILAVILTGQPPFAASSAEATRRKAVRGDLNECFERLSGCGADPEWIALCRRCLSPDPARRPADAGAVAAAVAVLRQEADERARRGELRVAEARTRRKVQLALAALAGLALVGGAVFARWQDRRAAEVERVVTRALGTCDQWTAQAAVMEVETVAGADAAVGLWRQGVAAAEHAEGVASASGRPSLLVQAAEHADRVRAGLRSAETAASRARRDAELVGAIETARELTYSGRLGGGQGVAEAHAAYARAFVTAGIDTSTPESLASALRTERPAVRAALIPALDRWMETSADQTERDRLRAALDSADDDPFRQQVRAAVVSKDRDLLLRVAGRSEGATLAAVTADQLGRGLFAVQEYAAAERVFRVARDRFPSDFWLTANLGTTLLLRQLSAAISPTATERGPRPAWPPEPARVEEILGCFRAAVALRPASVVGNTGVAFTLHMLKGDPLAAEPAYRKLVELAPASSASHLGLATVLQRKGDLDGAVVAFRKAIEVSPAREQTLAWVSLGRIYEQKADLIGALAAYAEAIRLDPTHAGAGRALARVMWLRLRDLMNGWVGVSPSDEYPSRNTYTKPQRSSYAL